MTKGFIAEETLAKHIQDDVMWARQYRQEREETWKALYALYKNFLDGETYPWRARLAIPTAHTIVEVQVPILLDMVFQSGSVVSVLGQTPKGQVSAPAVQKVLNHHLTQSFRIYEDMEQYIRQLLIFGTSVYKCFWDFRLEAKTRTVIEMQGEGLPPKYKRETNDEVTSNKPNGRPVDIWNFGIDPASGGPHNARFAYEEMWIGMPQLISMMNQGTIEKPKIEQLASSAPMDVNKGLSERYGKVQLEPHQLAPNNMRGQFHCIDYWGYITTPEKNEEDKFAPYSKTQLIHALVVDSGTASGENGQPLVLYSEPTPFYHNQLPFVASRLNATLDEFYGVGDIEYCESLLVEQRDLRNIHMDNLSSALNNMWKVVEGSGVDEDELIQKPNGIIHLRSLDMLEQIDKRPLDPAFFATENTIRADIEVATGVNDFVTGNFRSATGFNDTATGISLIQEMALKRIGHKGQIIQRAVRDIAEQAFMLIAQYNPAGHASRILDPASQPGWKFLSLSPRDLAESYDFNIVNTPSMGSRQMRVQQTFQILQLLMQTEEKTGQIADYKAIIRRILDEIGTPNSAELLGHPQFNAETMPLLEEAAGGVIDVSAQIPPEEENRLMVNGQSVNAKMGEDHPNHRLMHKKAYDEIDDPNARQLIARHDAEHKALMEQERSLLSQAAANQMQTQALTQQAQQLDALTKGTKSQGGGNGAANEMNARNFGQMLSGNG